MIGEMEAYVCDCDVDAEPFDFARVKIVTARKPHRCYECGAEITVGQKYEYCAAKFDRKMRDYHTCLPCCGIRRDYACGVYGGLRDTIAETLGFDYVTGDGMYPEEDEP